MADVRSRHPSGIDDLPRSKRFYCEGFGWTPVFENTEIALYQMNGLVLGTWLNAALCEDMQRLSSGDVRARMALAHNVQSRAHVEPWMDALLAAGG